MPRCWRSLSLNRKAAMTNTIVATRMSGLTRSTNQANFVMNNKYPSAVQVNGLASGTRVWSLVRLLQFATARQYMLNANKEAAKTPKLSARAMAYSVRIPG